MPHRLGHVGSARSAQYLRKKQRQRFPFGGEEDDRFGFLNDIFFGEGNQPTFQNRLGRFSRGLQPFSGSTRRGFQRRNLREFGRLGFGNQAGASFNPFAGTLGGIAPFTQSAEDQFRDKYADLGIPRPMGNVLGGAVSSGGARGGGTTGGKGAQGGLSAGDPQDTEDFGPGSVGYFGKTILDIFGGSGGIGPWGRSVGEGFDRARNPERPEPRRRTRITGDGQAAGAEFAGLDPLSQQLSTVGKEAQLAAIQQFRALANLGIFGPGGMQSILEQAEGPENAILDALPGRTSELLDYNKTQSANQRRRQLAGLGSQLGGTGVQRPGVAAAISAGSAVPVNIAEQDRAFGIQQGAYNTEDQINLGQGQRRAGLLEANMRSKAGGIAGLAGQAGQIAGILGPQFLDPANPLQNQLAYQTDILGQQFQNQLGLGAQGQRFQQDNMRLQNFLQKDLQQYMHDLRVEFEREFGQVDNDQWDRIIEAVKLGIKVYAGGA